MKSLKLSSSGEFILSRNAKKLKDKPIWVFHGAKDQVVPVENSKRMVSALKKVGGDPKLTIYPKAGHDSWSKTYNNPNFYKWLMSHELNPEESLSIKSPN